MSLSLGPGKKPRAQGEGEHSHGAAEIECDARVVAAAPPLPEILGRVTSTIAASSPDER